MEAAQEVARSDSFIAPLLTRQSRMSDNTPTAPKAKPSSTLALIGKRCPNCGKSLTVLENPPVIVPDDIRELDWDYVKNRALIPKILAICLACGFVAVESMTPVEVSGAYAGI